MAEASRWSRALDALVEHVREASVGRAIHEALTHGIDIGADAEKAYSDPGDQASLRA